ncbi:hypothetical protein DXG03_003388 [Asterophora parasitica]|uniref:C2H2-type domain-containing protein n=1 Tax=Asterophora parasitica TaxID=117018 RepID=A0A9P7G1K9_9AGAR|nr:hypothetical protein DXG03_003388 [Asterophora parasitica]
MSNENLAFSFLTGHPADEHNRERAVEYSAWLIDSENASTINQTSDATSYNAGPSQPTLQWVDVQNPDPFSDFGIVDFDTLFAICSGASQETPAQDPQPATGHVTATIELNQNQNSHFPGFDSVVPHTPGTSEFSKKPLGHNTPTPEDALGLTGNDTQNDGLLMGAFPTDFGTHNGIPSTIASSQVFPYPMDLDSNVSDLQNAYHSMGLPSAHFPNDAHISTSFRPLSAPVDTPASAGVTDGQGLQAPLNSTTLSVYSALLSMSNPFPVDTPAWNPSTTATYSAPMSSLPTYSAATSMSNPFSAAAPALPARSAASRARRNRNAQRNAGPAADGSSPPSLRDPFMGTLVTQGGVFGDFAFTCSWFGCNYTLTSTSGTPAEDAAFQRLVNLHITEHAKELSADKDRRYGARAIIRHLCKEYKAIRFACTVAGCTASFSRPDRITKHIRDWHGNQDATL